MSASRRALDPPKSEADEKIESEAKKAKRDAANHERHDVSHTFTHGPFVFVINHWSVGAVSGGKFDPSSYQSLDIDPRAANRIDDRDREDRVVVLNAQRFYARFPNKRFTEGIAVTRSFTRSAIS